MIPAAARDTDPILLHMPDDRLLRRLAYLDRRVDSARRHRNTAAGTPAYPAAVAEHLELVERRDEARAEVLHRMSAHR